MKFSTFAARETASLGQQLLNATVGINWLIYSNSKLEKMTSSVRDRLASLSIMGDQLRTPLKSPNTIECYNSSRVLREALNWAPMMQRHASLSDSCTSDLGCFSSLAFYDDIQISKYHIKYYIRIFY